MYERNKLCDVLYEAGYESLSDFIESMPFVALDEVDIKYAINMTGTVIDEVELDDIYNRYERS